MKAQLPTMLTLTTPEQPWEPETLQRLPDQPVDRSNGARRPRIQFDTALLRDFTNELGPDSRARQAYEFEALMVDVLTRFVNLPSHEVDRELEHALRRVCEHFRIERAGLWRNSQDPSSLVLTHRYESSRYLSPRAKGEAGCDPVDNGSSSERQMTTVALGTESRDCFPWLTANAKKGKAYAFSRIADLPKEAGQDQKALRRFGVRSSMFIPFLVRGAVFGAVSFDMLTQEKEWPELLVRRLEFVVGVFAEATARKLSDEQLRASEAQLSLAAASAGAALWSLDLETRRFQTTDKARELLRLPPGSAIGFEGLIEMIHPEDRGRVRDATEDAVRNCSEIDIEFRVVLAGKGTYWVNSRGRCQCGATGLPERILGASVDITEKKEAQAALARSFEEIKQLKDRLQAETEYLKAGMKTTQAHSQIIGRSQGIKRVLRQTEQVANAGCPVLISGETGTGKELIALEIHRLSARWEKAMVLVNCAALPSALVESELFGRERGAYTGALTSQVGRFEVANGSTIFLDEVGELSMEVQAKLLRVLQQGEFQRLGSPKTHKVDVRVIAATNRDLAQEVRKGRFREDLYYRLRVFPIDIPPLRERLDDIPLLVFAFMEEFSTRMGKKITKIPRKAMEALQGHYWQGNIRELRNVIEHSVILSSGDTLRLTIVGESPTRDAQPVTLAEAEREHILKTLESTGWRIKGPHGAAARLDLQPSTLYSRMQKLGIPHRRQKDEMATQGWLADLTCRNAPEERKPRSS